MPMGKSASAFKLATPTLLATDELELFDELLTRLDKLWLDLLEELLEELLERLDTELEFVQ